MAAPNPSGIWSKVDYELVDTGDTAVAAPTAERGQTLDQLRQFWRWRRPVLDVVASLLWLYGLLKVFVADIDTTVLGSAARYRFFFFLGLAVVLVLLLRKRAAILGGVLYIVGFPAVLLCWKLPKLVGKARSPVAFLAAANAVTLLVSDIKRSVVAFALATFSTLAVVTSHWRPLLALASLVLLLLLLRATYRTIKLSLVPSSFLKAQQKAIKTIVGSAAMRQLTKPADELTRADVERFTAVQQTTFTQSLANGVIAHRVLNYWAYQLERYRRSPASLIFNALAYFWLVVRVILGLALLNLALYHADPAAFSYANRPTVLELVRYVSAGLAGGEIAGLHPESALANALSVATFFAGLLVGGSVLVSSALAFRAARDESDLRDTVVEIKREGARLDARLMENYDVSVTEAIERLEQLKYGLMGVIRYLSTRIPAGFEDS